MLISEIKQQLQKERNHNYNTSNYNILTREHFAHFKTIIFVFKFRLICSLPGCDQELEAPKPTSGPGCSKHGKAKPGLAPF